MKKTFFNISTRGGDLQATTKTKRKFLRTFSFTSLALLMGAAGVFAFAPLGASTSVANASELETTTEQGLITTKADDPVIYTTESGIEIKWGNAVPDTINSSLGSGNLKGFPYFTTSNGSTTYTWVIIGRNSNVTTINTAVQSYLFSTWQANNSTSNDWVLGNHFFDNTYETTTPAGSAINNVVPSKSYVNDNIFFSINDITTNDNEIPSGCVLVLANNVLGTGTYNNGAVYVFNNEYCAIYERGINIASTMHGYYSNKSYGISSIYDQIQEVPLATKFSRCYKGTYHYYSKDNSTNNDYASDTPKYSNHYIFPLAANADSTFYYEDYITLTQMSCSSAQFLRGSHTTTYDNTASGYNNDRTTILAANASSLSLSYVRSTCGYRPAFVLKIT